MSDLELTMSRRVGELNKENARLKAEVERLTKAGDAMDAYLKRQDGTTNGMLDCRHQWHAAKEGKGQS